MVLAATANAAIQNAGVTQFTATQAILSYQAPDSSPCTVEVSENASLTPLVNDLNPARFDSASSDSRTGNVQAGGERFFVIGKRAAEVGLDGVRYSRALQADTQHYFRITCPGAGNMVSGSFRTANIPFGATYVEPVPGDPKNPGALAEPHISLSDRTDTVIDPQTGMLLKRLSSGNDSFQPINGFPFGIARSSSWQNLGNIFSQNNASATAVASTGPLFLGLKTGPIPGAAPYTNSGPGMTSYAQAYQGIYLMISWGYYQVHLVAAVNVGGQAPANADDGKITACLTIDGVNCYAGAATYEAALRTSLSDVTFGTQAAGDIWQQPGGAAPNWTVEGTRNGKLVCNGTATATLASPEYFGVHWVNGSSITINGVDYTVSQVLNTSAVILSANCPSTNGASVPFSASNFGVLIRKKTTSSDTISIDYGYVNYELNFYRNFTTGKAELCSDFTVTGPNGRPGYNCQTPGAALYWVDADSGESHLFSNLTTSPNRGCDSQLGQIFSAQNPDRYFCAGTGPLYTVTYYGNHSEPPLNSNGRLKLDQGLGTCPANPPTLAQQPCNVIALATPGTDIPSLTEAYTSNPAYAPAFEKSKFKYGGLRDVDASGNLVLAYSRGSSYSIGWNVVFNPTATQNSEGGTMAGAVGNHGCVGNGNPGCIVAAMPAWERAGCRWCTIKEVSVPNPGWTLTTVYGWGGSQPGQGPYQVNVIDGSANGTGNSFGSSSTWTACPPNNYGFSGNRCTRVTVGSEPYTAVVHDSTETGLPGEIGIAEIGDRFATQVQLPINAVEQMTLLRKDPGAAPGTWVYTLGRSANHTDNFATTTGPNPPLITVCNSNSNPSKPDSGYNWVWDFVNDPHGLGAAGSDTFPPNPTDFNGHSFLIRGNYVDVEEYSYDSRCYHAGCYGAKVMGSRTFVDTMRTPTLDAMISTFPPWSARGGVDFAGLQSHVTDGGSGASPERTPWFFDGRPYRGGYASGSNSGSGSNPATPITGQLWKFTAASMPNIDLPFRKFYPTAAFSGRYPLIDVSSPARGDVMGSERDFSFKYCVAAVAGECRSGSAVGDTYVNAPFIRYPFCYQAGQNGNLSDEQDICISGSASIRDGILQVGMGPTDLAGRSQRVLTKFITPRVVSVFWTPYLLANGKWMIFESQFPGDGTANKALMLGKVPPPGNDKIDRTRFSPIVLRVPAVPGSRVIVRFGYAENGDPGSFFCTSRAERCIATGRGDSLPDSATPFYFEQIESQSIVPVDCSTGCSVVVPGIPQRVMYYQVVYLDSSNNAKNTPVLSTVVP